MGKDCVIIILQVIRKMEDPMKKQILLITTMILMTVLITACTSTKKNSNDESKKTIVTTSFVGYDIAKHLVGDKGVVTNVLPWGSELHNFEPKAKDKVAIEEADLFIYLGQDFDPWVKENGKQKNALDLSEGHETEGHEGETDVHGIHFWADPIVFYQLIEETRDALIKTDPHNKDYYTERAKDYADEIMAIHQELEAFVQTKENKTLYFAGHNAMGPFAERYGLTIVALSNETQPDADITGKQIAKLQDDMVKNQARYLFIEELATPKVANQIKTSLAHEGYEITLLELNGYHNISKKQFEKGVSYADLFKKNGENIKTALDH